MDAQHLKALALVATLETCALAFDHQTEKVLPETLTISDDSQPLIDSLRDKGLIKTKHVEDRTFVCIMTTRGWKEFGRQMADRAGGK